MATKKRESMKIFDDDGIVIESKPAEEKKESVYSVKSAKSAGRKTEINVADVLDAYAGYMPQRFGMNDASLGAGECVICGGKTQYTTRKICVPCLDKYGKEIYKNAKEAIENSQISFELRTNG